MRNMCARPDYRIHTACFVALFTVGNAVITFPKAGTATVMGFATAVLAAVGAYFLSIAACRIAVGRGVKPKRAIKVPLLFSAAAISAYCALDCFIDFCGFANALLLPESPNFAVAVLFILVVAVLSLKPNSVLMKLSLFFAACFVVAVPILILLTVKDFSVAGLNIGGAEDIKNGICASVQSIALPALLIPPYILIENKNAPEASGTYGLLCGLTTTALCVLDSLLLFGTGLSEKLAFPFATAVSTVTVGTLFTRMDGPVYCLFFMSAVIKSVLCIRLCAALFKKMRCII